MLTNIECEVFKQELRKLADEYIKCSNAYIKQAIKHDILQLSSILLQASKLKAHAV
ncbi:hypothetical protein M3689_05355 [Alkalihalophilus marmarensis]|jgi:hypothetical protein|uniref:Uncharacterized protein n=1 Tax=Alkalihalophilus marmarensis DSM 21297 TaxID=1188261 RepID=U6SSN2_9BACI|nr:hypothetical protein [Alkalihalophilus marmarensis]ERN54648.1 hypothetical protein A33I_04695 [Alkalihalophilus marmarensis DSM 21297]MCM3488732.1 hypothetical protein [Alkalihalophilus marmarensis]